MEKVKFNLKKTASIFAIYTTQYDVQKLQKSFLCYPSKNCFNKFQHFQKK
jgi:hypothetical protein